MLQLRLQLSLLAGVLLQFASGAFTVEEPSTPYSLSISIGTSDDEEHGGLTLREREFFSESHEVVTKSDVHVKFNASLGDDFYDEIGIDPDKSLILKTESGLPVSIFDVTFTRNASYDNITDLNYHVIVNPKVARRELVDLLLRTFARGRSSFNWFEVQRNGSFSLNNVFLEVVTDLGVQISHCNIEYGMESPSLDLVMKFVKAVRPTILTLRIGDEQGKIKEPRLVLPDSFFQNEVVRNISIFKMERIDTGITDESLRQLNATSFQVREAAKISAKGIRQWLEATLKWQVKRKVLDVKQGDSSEVQADLARELAKEFNHTWRFADGGELWTFPSFKNKTGTFFTTLTFRNTTVDGDRYFELAAENERREDNGISFTSVSFVALFACATLVPL